MMTKLVPNNIKATRVKNLKSLSVSKNEENKSSSTNRSAYVHTNKTILSSDNLKVRL
jgi:hypothetical protein